MKPNLFIVGAPKSGTTSLHHYLGQHPDVCMSRIKEPNYFSRNEIGDLYYGTKPVRSAQEYESLFAFPAKVVGEASVSYLFYKDVPDRIKRYSPAARILIVLRDPVDRAISHYKMDQRLGFCPVRLSEILDAPSHFAIYFRQFVELGDYSIQVRRYLETFGAESVRILKYDSLKENPGAFMDDVFAFLGLERIPVNLEARNRALIPRNAFAAALYQRSYVRKIAKHLLPSPVARAIQRRFLRGKEQAVESGVIETLAARYRPDLRALANLVDFDISDWQRAR